MGVWYSNYNTVHFGQANYRTVGNVSYMAPQWGAGGATGRIQGYVFFTSISPYLYLFWVDAEGLFSIGRQRFH